MSRLPFRDAAGRARIGIDLGGTKIAGVVLDAEGRIAVERRVATPVGDYRGTVAAVRDLVAALESETGAGGLSVGVGTPGSVSPSTGLIRNANSVCLNGQPLGRDLEAALARPVRLANDADCLAVSEAADGAGADADSVFAVILGTGVGGGFVHRGQLLAGANGIAGEWGHNPLPWTRDPSEWPGPVCWCGRTGCLETWLSGPALAADYRQRGGTECDARVIVTRAGQGEALAQAVLADYEHRLGRALAGIINVLDPAVIVLGGGLSQVSRFYEHLPALWTPFVFADRVVTGIRPAVHGDASGVRGAAWLW